MNKIEVEKAYIDAFFFEYKFIRDEILSTNDQLYGILQFGSTALLSFIGIGFSFWGKNKQDIVLQVILGFLTPTMAFVFIELLVGQIARIRRAGKYCQMLERKGKILLSGKSSLVEDFGYPIGWEIWLEGEQSHNGQHMKWIYGFGILLFATVSLFSLSSYFYYQITIVRPDYHNYMPVLFLLIPSILEIGKTFFWVKQVVAIIEKKAISIVKKEHLIENGEK